ncbi:MULTISPECIES: HAD family hydrolase [unclassified Methylobacterium]|uniref:HAD family hydrolase n=1 Tax=unclassified Methylobacterium TaxID=2615210 RepID=UPI0036F5D5E9
MSTRIRAVVFDIDGTLLDSVDLHARAWVEAFAQFEIETEEAQVRRQIGKGGDQLLPVFVDEARLARDGEAIESYRSDLFKRDYLPLARPFPGVRVLLSHVRDAGQIVALASSGKASEVENYQKILGITDLVDVVTTADDAERSKPHPDIFEAVLGKLPDLPKEAVMVVGDTPYDVQAAAKAGLSAIGVLCGGFPEAELSAAGCVAIYRDPQDLLDGYARSPLG